MATTTPFNQTYVYVSSAKLLKAFTRDCELYTFPLTSPKPALIQALSSFEKSHGKPQQVLFCDFFEGMDTFNVYRYTGFEKWDSYNDFKVHNKIECVYASPFTELQYQERVQEMTEVTTSYSPEMVQDHTEGKTAKKTKKARKIDGVEQPAMPVTPTQAELPTEPAFSVYNSDETDTRLFLSELVALDETPIERASLAIRTINTKALDLMYNALERGEQFPPILCIITNKGPVVLGGYHRWAMYEKHAQSTLPMNATEEMIQSARTSYAVPVRIVAITGASEKAREEQAITIAFEDNMRHGVGANEQTRGRYGAYLYLLAKERGEETSLEKIAKRVGCTRAAIHHVLDKMKQAAKKAELTQIVEASYQPDSDTEAMLAGEDADKAYKKNADRMLRILKAFSDTAKFWSEQTDKNTMEIRLLLKDFVHCSVDELESYKDVLDVAITIAQENEKH